MLQNVPKSTHDNSHTIKNFYLDSPSSNKFKRGRSNRSHSSASECSPSTNIKCAKMSNERMEADTVNIASTNSATAIISSSANSFTSCTGTIISAYSFGLVYHALRYSTARNTSNLPLNTQSEKVTLNLSQKSRDNAFKSILLYDTKNVCQNKKKKISKAIYELLE